MGDNGISGVSQYEKCLASLKEALYRHAAEEQRPSPFEMVETAQLREDFDAIAAEARRLLTQRGYSEAMGTAAEVILLMESVKRLNCQQLKQTLGSEVAELVHKSLVPEALAQDDWLFTENGLACIAEMSTESHTLRAALLLAQWHLLPDSSHHVAIWWREVEQLGKADQALLEALQQGLKI